MGIKKKAIEHWKENIKIIKEMDWKAWKALEDLDKIFISRGLGVLENFSSKAPKIFSENCPYCKKYFEKDGSCKKCPLNNGSKDCCKPWQKVLKRVINNPTKRKKAVKAAKKMLEYIKERG